MESSPSPSSIAAGGEPTSPATYIVMFPSAGMGHLIPLIQFAKRLIPRFSFTLAIPTSTPPSSSQISLLSSLPPGIHPVFLPPIHLSDNENPMLFTVPRSLPSLRQLILNLRPAVLLLDLFSTDAIDVALELGIRPYIFYPSPAMALSLFLYLDELEKMEIITEPVMIPGCVPLMAKDLVDVFQDRNSEAYKWVLWHCKRYRMAEGIIVNSFEGIENGPIQALRNGKHPVYPVGPLVQSKAQDHCCLKWLDDQPPGSVLLVSFGSGGTLSTEQTTELAHGLAQSQHRFLWVVRRPNDVDARAAYFGADELVYPLRILPEGFADQTAGRGFVVANRAPQIEILGHASTGGFLTHCGWNSVLESIVHGVPMITWPLFAEQKMNAVMLSEDLRVGIRPNVGSDGIVRENEVARVVMELMDGGEGKKMKSRMEDLKGAALDAMSLDHGSSSSKALNEIATIWESQAQ